jgi:hypothetical protein
MPIHGIEKITGPDPGIRIYKTTTEFLEIRKSDLPPGNPSKKRAWAIDTVHAFFEVRVPLADLDPDDPDKTIEPTHPFMWWDNGDLVSRSIDVSDVQLSDLAEDFGSFTISRRGHG